MLRMRDSKREKVELRERTKKSRGSQVERESKMGITVEDEQKRGRVN